METRKPLSFEERKIIESYRDQPVSCGYIANKMNRSKNVIVAEFRRGGKREFYTAEKGQETYENNKKVGYNVIARKYNPSNHPAARMKDKIESLQMQMEILTELIKELLSDKEIKKL